MTGQDPCRSIVVVGGGIAGVLVARHVLRLAKVPVSVTILEPRDRLGAGVAYSSAEPVHITNVPSSRMSIDAEEPDAFVRWLERHGDTPTGEERDAYPRRWLFGDHVADFFAAARADRPDIAVVHSRQRAHDIERRAVGFLVHTDAGPLAADAVVLATGNPTPQLPEILRPVAASPRCIVDPWALGALADVPADARVLIVGTGLTMADTVAALGRSGHRGEIVALSRRGQLPRRGLSTTIAPFGDFSQPPSTAIGLLRLFRSEVRRAAAAGTSWYAVLAAARAAAWSLWAAMPPPERRRFVRHVRLFYEIHRHVMPGPVHDLIVAALADGKLSVRPARLTDARPAGSGFAVALQPRGAGAASAAREGFDVIVNCTGPAYGVLMRTDPLWAGLTRRGLVREDPSGLGPESDRQGRAIGAGGIAQPDLLLAGTLARSAFGELTGVREIAAEASLAAEGLLAAWDKGHQASGVRALPLEPVLASGSG